MAGQQFRDSKADKHGGAGGSNQRPVLVMPGQGTQVLISRPPFTQVAFDELHLHQPGDLEQLSLPQKLKNNCFCTKKRLWRLLTTYIPVIRFIRYYKLKEYAIIDIVAGLTVGTIHLPQALAFGLLASAKIENGLLGSLWPPLVYLIFGTSPHVSMGTSAVICLLTASAIDKQADTWLRVHHLELFNTSRYNVTPDCTKLSDCMDFKEEIAMSLSLIIGIVLIVLGFLKLGFIVYYLSDSFFAAFTSAAAVHIGTTQLPPMLGISAYVKKYPGSFKFIYTFRDIFDNLQHSNFAAIIIALISIFVIYLVKEFVNDKFKHRLPAPIPIELFVVIFGTIASHFGSFQEKFKVVVVGPIPMGIPQPKVPLDGLAVASDYVADAIVMAIITFAYTIAIAKICAKKHNYEVDDSQEMISYGLLNFASSFLQCIPACVSPPRSMVASGMNAKTTLNGIMTCIFMFLVVMIVASLFRDLPKAVLGAIIFVSLFNLFIQIKDVYKYWCVNKIDFIIWMCTFFVTVFVDIDIGLYVGVGVSAIFVLFQTQFAKGYKLGYTKRDTMLVVHKKYKDSVEISGIKIFRFRSNLYYANSEIFRNALYRKTVNPRKLLKGLQKREKRLQKNNEERLAQGLPPQIDNNFIMTGELDKAEMIDNLTDTTTLPPYPSSEISVMKSSQDHDHHDNHSSPEVTSLESDSSSKRELIDPVQQSNSNGKRSHLSGIDNPVFVIDGKQLISNGHHLNEISSVGSTITKRRNNDDMDRSRVTDSVISLFSIRFDDYIEDPEDGEELFTDEKLRQMRKIHHIVVDCSPINYMDASGANVLMHIYTEYSHVNIKLYLAGCCSSIRRTMRLAGVFNKIPENHFFVDVHDAVSYARPQKPQPIRPENLQDFTDEEAMGNSRAVLY